MKNIQSEGKGVEKKVGASEMRKLVFFGAAGLKVAREILERLESIDVSISILAAQKERELNQEEAASPDPAAK